MQVNSIPLHVTPEDARGRPNDAGHPSARVMAHGSMEVRRFRPTDDRQHTPHDRDEVYFVVSGTATFHRAVEADPFEEAGLALLGTQQVTVAPGDLLFVPAGAEHHFSDIAPDFMVWAVFYGPDGGERP